MIKYEQTQLSNGLTVIANRDTASRMAAVNILYKVGARDENPNRTGLAHLFEHLMFRGTHLIPDFDTPVQMACGENNAFTNNDYTDFYITLPCDNIETALWLESDRMTGLNLSAEACEIEKRVVIEEFRQRYLNQPYGDLNMLLREMVYTTHPYRWATIGISPDHIAEASIEEIHDFYHRHYHPSNAILSISGDIAAERVFEMAEKWFGGIKPNFDFRPAALPTEPKQTTARRLEVERDVPATTIVIAFHMGNRLSKDFYLGDITSDLLAGGDSARLYEHLIKGKSLFASVNAYISGDVDEGMFVFTGQLLPTTTEQDAEAALWEEIRQLQSGEISDYELEKVKNKFEANTLFGELNVMNKAMNMGYYSMIGDLPLINREIAIYRSLTKEQIADFSRNTFTQENSSTLIYRAKR
ncbi:MAG: insulinase family protein [Rikenellaceae bacterium]|nr:insulinase family protein [Rikenellaceae bacterium]